jgi:hypothetical protein
MRIALTCLCLTFISASVSAQSGMNRAEAAQLYSAAGFSIRNDQPVNRCGKPAKPRVTFVDLNGDKRPEALFIDVDAACYAGFGRYFAVLIKDGASWRPIISGIGSIEALSSSTAGWLDMRVSDSSCVRDHRYDGRTYKPTASCSGGVVATAPKTAQPVPGTAPVKNAAATLQAADEAAAFKVAGFTKRGGAWRSGCNDPGTPSYSPGAIDKVDDLNGDGLPDVVLTEGGTFCYGNTGQGYWLVSKLANGSWRLITNGTGVPEFLKTKGTDGWPDVSIGGPGFCFPVERWNGREYKVQRWEYEGKACKPPR